MIERLCAVFLRYGLLASLAGSKRKREIADGVARDLSHDQARILDHTRRSKPRHHDLTRGKQHRKALFNVAF